MINEPFCGRIDCFANHNSGLCRILQYGYYGEKSCPFYSEYVKNTRGFSHERFKRQISKE